MFSVRASCMISLLLWHVLDASQQLRPDHWREFGRWHEPVDYIAESKLDLVDENCLANEKCMARFRAEKEHQLQLLFTGGEEDDVFEDTAVKRLTGKQHRGNDESTIVPTSYNHFEGGKFFKSSHPISCTCETRHKLMDLGHAYYPRYVSGAVCTPELCSNTPFRCRPKHHTMYFLKRRDENTADSDVQTPTPPEVLRKDWVFEALPIAVTCECAP